MKSSRFEKDKKVEDHIIKHVRNLFRIKQEIDDTTIKDIRNLFRVKKKKKREDTTIENKRKLFRLKNEEKDYYKLVRVGNLWGDNNIKYESNGGRKKMLSVKEYLYEVIPYLKDIINVSKNLTRGKFN